METTNFDSFDQSREIPNNNMTLAIIATIAGCCFSPCYLPGLVLGIIAIVNANKVNPEYDRGNHDGAEKAAKNAKTFSYIALGLAAIGLIFNLVILVFFPDFQQKQIEKFQEILEQAQQGQ